MLPRIIVFLAVLLFAPFSFFNDSIAQSEFDSTELGLPMPEITMTPTSGGPGTEVKIHVASTSSVPKDIDPRIEFFIYLPFLSSVGGNIPQTCGGDSCFALYTFDEVREAKFPPKTITFGLFSTTNPKPTLESDGWKSVCDLKINGKTTERYGNVCINNDQPIGDYDIKFGWGIQTSELYDIREIMTFTVTEKEFVPEAKKLTGDELVFQEFEDGLITESELEKRLTELGYDPEELRQAKALLGILKHQEGYKIPLNTPITIQGTEIHLSYGISGGQITQVYPNADEKSLMVEINSFSNGTLQIKLPREVIDAKFGAEDDDFIVIVDGLMKDFEETKTGKERTLTVEFPEGTEEIEIIGTFVIPEFGSITMAILIISIISLIIASKTKLVFYKI